MSEEVQPTAWRPLTAVTAAVAIVLIALSGRYGYHRDELYFLACGRHLAWGYPDQPPLTPFLAWAMNGLGHGSLVVFRLPATASAAGVALVTGLMARELGGGRAAQVLAAVGAGTAPFVLASGHLLVTSTIDLLVWVVLTWLVIHILRTGAHHLWLLAGVVAGLGLLNKQLPIVLLLGLLVGILATPSARPALGSGWLWAGVVVAAAMWTPVLVWQAQHGWPQLTLAGQIRDEYGTPGQRLGFLVFQIALFGGATGLWVTGLRRVWRDPAWQAYRVLGWTWLVVFTFFVVTAGQGYYPAGAYPMLVAVGAVIVERGQRRRWSHYAWSLAVSALVAPALVPILTPAALGGSPWNGLGETQRETIGWPQLVDEVAAAYQSVPAARRGNTVLYATNYGEAGAIDRFGSSRGLPHAWSGHNGYGLWGPPPQTVAPVVVVWEDGPPDGYFSDCREFAPVTAPVSNEESDRAAVYVCSGPVGGWANDWPRLVHLSS